MESQNVGMLATYLLSFMFFLFCLIVFYIVCKWKIFQKAGQAGWKSLVPIYNIYIQLKIAKQPAIWLLFFCIPFLNIYFAIRHVHGISKAFGKDVGFTLGLIFLSFIFIPILAFGDAEYIYKDENSLIDEIQEYR